MKNLILLSILLFVFLNSCREKQFSYIDDYYQTVYIAEEAFHKKKYQKVFDLMSELEKKTQLLNQGEIYEIMKFAISSAYLRKNKKTIELSKELIFHGFDIKYLEDEIAFSEIIKTNEWKKLIEEYPELHKEYIKTINIDLRNELKEMTRNDQKYRLSMNIPRINKDSLWRLQTPIDSFNNVRLQEIINEYGYPNSRIIGGYSIDEVFVDPSIILHHVVGNDYYTKTLLKQIDKGKAPPSTLGNYVDSHQRRVKEKKKWIYGIYDGVDSSEFIDYENLDKRRISIGLAPLKLHIELQEYRLSYFN